jgi:hypothetical protein
MSKFSIGDRVRIKSLRHSGFAPSSEQGIWADNTATVTDIVGDSYVGVRTDNADEGHDLCGEAGWCFDVRDLELIEVPA